MAVKLTDVAAKANVSVSTVSRVINNKNRVNEATRKKVLKAISSLGYYPNDVARSMRGSGVKMVAVVVPDVSNGFYASVVKGVESVLRPKGYSVIICSSNDDIKEEEQCVQMLLQKQISGLLIATVGGICKYYEQYIRNKIPVVFFDNSPQMEQSFDFVSIDNFQASYELVEYLIGLGHQKIAVLAGAGTDSSTCDRLNGWKRAMKQNALPVAENQIWRGNASVEGGAALMQEILRQKSKPTAIFATNNFLAYGAVRAILAAGFRIPEDFAVACFDAIDETGLMTPRITTSVQPPEEIGEIAGELLANKLGRPKITTFQKIILEHKLLIRESTQKPERK